MAISRTDALPAKIRWAIFGTSFISHTVAEAFSSAETAELAGVASHVEKESTTTFAKKYGIKKIFNCFEDALKDPDIDAIYLGIPNHLHVKWSQLCAKAGKHFLVEKPWASSPIEVEISQALARENKVVGMEGLMYQCHPFIIELQQLVDDKLGGINSITASYSADISKLENPTQGGAIRNLGCYPLSLVRLLTKSEPIEIIGYGEMDTEYKRDKISHAILTFKNGLTATITTSHIHNKFSQLTIFGKNGGIINVLTNPWLPSEENEVMLSLPARENQILKFTAKKPLFTYEIDYVGKRIQEKGISPERPGVTWEHSIGNAKCIETWINLVMKKPALVPE